MSRRQARRFSRLGIGIVAAAATAMGLACGIDFVGERPTFIPVEAAPDVEPSLPPKPDAPPPDPHVGDATIETCPEGLSGPTLVPVPGTAFCIDATEVSNADYALFLTATDGGTLDASVPEAGLPARCSDLASFVPVGAPPLSPPKLPVTRISWCAAFAYCAWAGKHLCGNVVDRDASTGDWYAACSNRGTRLYPYGSAFVSGACNDDSVVNDVEPVGARPTCEGGVPGLFDMAGNVAEWLDDCDDAGDASVCLSAASYYSTPGADSTCAYRYAYSVGDSNAVLGFRCCASR